MKKIINSVIAFLAIAAMASCTKTTEGVTGTTYYPIIKILGNNPAIVVVGSQYADEGCNITLNGEDITDKGDIYTNVNPNEMGIYQVVYSAVNADGFWASATRTVIVANPGSLDNIYWGESQFGSRHYYDAPVKISKRSDGLYLIDDLLGGFYWNGRYPGYEPTYDFHLEAILKLNDDNSIEVVQQGSWYFGDEVDVNSAQFYPEDGEIHFNLALDGTDFIVTLCDVTK